MSALLRATVLGCYEEDGYGPQVLALTAQLRDYPEVLARPLHLAGLGQ
ncbi:hypothetical protein QF035_007282 [Streptomyces umbrinus]|uniref:Uncharacterized protein n=1 Tax=Streptomyces umbrinus TaxID=67370 RepID=A0ABU0T1L5_9ACTN|nr:hypothetical protein [Streptomyces umbrinus]MDQ1029700.1 hypothetical protein [Streptomyces umbrinus]